MGAPPSRLPDLPMAERSPFGNHERSRAEMLDGLRHQCQRPVGLQADEVEIGRAFSDEFDGLLVQRGYRGRRGVVAIERVDQAREFVDLVVDARIGEAHIEFVADDPSQQRRVVLVAQHRVLDVLPLLRHAGSIVVVEAETFRGHRQAERDRQSVLLR